MKASFWPTNNINHFFLSIRVNRRFYQFDARKPNQNKLLHDEKFCDQVNKRLYKFESCHHVNVIFYMTSGKICIKLIRSSYRVRLQATTVLFTGLEQRENNKYVCNESAGYLK